MRLIDEARETVARSGFAADVEAKGGKKRNLGLRRDRRALSLTSHHSPATPAALASVSIVSALGAPEPGPPFAVRASARMSEERA